MGNISSVLNTIDLWAEVLTIVLAGFIIYRAIIMGSMLNNIFRRPLVFYISGMGAIALAISAELVSQHFTLNSVEVLGDMRDILLALGVALLSVSMYKFSVLVTGSGKQAEQ